MKILQLETHLFPDHDSVVASIGELENEHVVSRINVGGDTMDDAAWDAVVTAILAADMTITV